MLGQSVRLSHTSGSNQPAPRWATSSASQRGYGAPWRKARALALDRDKGLCVPCVRHGYVSVAREVDHVTPRSMGGGEDQSNLQSICARCHAIKSGAESHQADGSAALAAWWAANGRGAV